MENSNNKRGSRLKECRELRHMTQEQFAKKVACSANYISMLERGDRVIDWDKAVRFAEILDVSPSYLMCESDIVDQSQTLSTYDFKTQRAKDTLLLNYFLASGHTLSFHVVRLFNENEPLEKDFHGDKHLDYNALQEEVSLDQLDGFCLYEARCKLRDGDTISEVVIVNVTLNDTRFTYGEFVFLIKQICSYMDFILKDAKRLKCEQEMSQGADVGVENLIENRHAWNISGSMKALKAREKFFSGDTDAIMEVLGYPDYINRSPEFKEAVENISKQIRSLYQ